MLLLAPIILSYLVTASASSWDLAVTVGNKIDFIRHSGNLTTTTIIANATTIEGIAYDDKTDTLFLSDIGDKEYSIVSIDLTKKNITIKPLLKREKGSQIPSIAFDSQSRTLFWATRNSIVKMRLPLDGQPNKPVVLHKLETKSPGVVALDVCNRYLYWVQVNESSKPSIMRSKLDGSNVTVIVDTNLYLPTSIAVDHWTSRLYWLDDEEGIHYEVEESNLDGSERLTIVHGMNQNPIYLAVDQKHIYWSDYVYKAIWQINKNPSPNDGPRKFKNYEANLQSYPTSLLSRRNLGSEVNCKAMKAQAEKRMTTEGQAKSTVTMTGETKPTTAQNFSNLTTNSEQQSVLECFNQGHFDKANKRCRCKAGFSGLSCEISPCHNYCLQGKCHVNDKGLPICTCEKSHTGSRCEKDACDGFCLNNGQCVVDNGMPTCECKYSSGARCEVTLEIAEICALFCIHQQFQITGIDTSSCQCSELNQTIKDVLGYESLNCRILVPLLSGFIGMLLIAVILLSVYVSRLHRRPRIKKRFVVNKSGITPLTSRPSQLGADQQCEITIENCCNMNICETPCFEPKLRTSNGNRNTVSNGKKKEEKSNLLDHMEDGNRNSC